MSGDAERPILVLGANGQLGHELPRALSGLGRVIALDRAAADLSDPESLRGVLRRHEAGIIVNAAAYTAVDRAESEPDLAQTINGDAPGVLAEEAQSLGATLVHFSTDYVFDGHKASPYLERDQTNPLSAYGRSKLSGERAVARACQRHLIFRTSWVFGAHGGNFLKTILRLAAGDDGLRVVADQVGAPTSSRLIANVTRQALVMLWHAQEDDARWGLYHIASAGETSWHAYARYVVEHGLQRGMRLKVTPDAVAPITTAEYPVAARRPANSRLDTGKLRTAFALTLPHWKREVDQVLNELTSGRTR